MIVKMMTGPSTWPIHDQKLFGPVIRSFGTLVSKNQKDIYDAQYAQMTAVTSGVTRP